MNYNLIICKLIKSAKRYNDIIFLCGTNFDGLFSITFLLHDVIKNVFQSTYGQTLIVFYLNPAIGDHLEIVSLISPSNFVFSRYVVSSGKK